ncbi:molecular chaperone DnaJ [Winogradskyella arenosi]|uniref:Uncharacterized protein n=1 Tax=Winogradskyella arenosi TaxID=533325 RepID=A0A368ZDI8_9FLAO|nr:molecular chaperone DnaJ [Winogradskyella arenosi]RCW91317.1 hypothetical protein DFQ08_103144 [Winogradskyella arenosi]
MIVSLIQIKKDSALSKSIAEGTEVTASNIDLSISIWFWLAIIECIIIIYLVFKLKKRNVNLDFADISKDKLNSVKSSSIDMGNVMNSINSSRGLYKNLSRLCHPDRFINSEKQELAESIFQEITKHKRNFQKLSELKQRAKEELEIKM